MLVIYPRLAAGFRKCGASLGHNIKQLMLIKVYSGLSDCCSIPQSARKLNQFPFTLVFSQRPSVMYGGDEVSATEIDMGSQPCKAGYTGEDTPKAVFPSVVGAIDQMEVDDVASAEKNSGSGGEGQNNAKIPDSDKTKAKRKLYVGSQALRFRLDHMEEVIPHFPGVVPRAIDALFKQVVDSNHMFLFQYA